ncbi:MAG: autotransporter outer membrane beta-barrel domain-containing protein, partial [Holosporaceae bacterium]|nr:autotransporter outer membrane beta-barrel domain-containing protein [Holosporaceae bacterium]
TVPPEVHITLNVVTNKDGDDPATFLNTKLSTSMNDDASNTVLKLSNIVLKQSGDNYNSHYSNNANEGYQKKGVKKIIYTKDNSDFKGLFELSGETIAIIAKDAQIFGGPIKIGDNSILKWNYNNSSASPITFQGTGTLEIYPSEETSLSETTLSTIIKDFKGTTKIKLIVPPSDADYYYTIDGDGSSTNLQDIPPKVSIDYGGILAWSPVEDSNENNKNLKIIEIEKGGTLIVNSSGYTGNDVFSTYRAISGNGIVEQTGGEVKYVGDNSEFKGDFRLNSGTATVANEGVIFGGDIYINNNTLFYWDITYSHTSRQESPDPEIKINNGTMIVHGPEIVDDDTKYGDINGMITRNIIGNGTIRQTKGYVYYVGDNSEFKGNFEIIGNGTTAIIKETNEGSYSGKSFSGPIYIDSGSEVQFHMGEGTVSLGNINLQNNGTLQILAFGDCDVTGSLTTSSGNGTIKQVIGKDPSTCSYSGDNSKFAGTLEIGQSGEAGTKDVATATFTPTGKIFKNININSNGKVIFKGNEKDTSNICTIKSNDKTAQVIIESGMLTCDCSDFNGKIEVLGTMAITGNATQLKSLSVDGGLLKACSEVDRISAEKLSFGSTLDTMNGSIVEVTANELELLTRNDPMKWKLDFDVTHKTCDHITTNTFENVNNNRLVIPEYAVLGDFSEDQYDFQILNITDTIAIYPEIYIENPIYRTNYSVYELSAPDKPNGHVLLKFISGLSGAKEKDMKEIYVPTQLTHMAVLSSITSTFDAIYDNGIKIEDSAVLDGKHRVWNRSRTYDYNFHLSGSNSTIDIRGYSTVFGVDAKPLPLENGRLFVPTLFLSCVREDSYHTRCNHSNSSIGGLKLSWLDEDYGNTSLICSYGTVRTGLKDCTIRSHVFSLSSRYTNSLPLGKNISLVPLAQLDYSHMITEDTLTERLLMRHNNLQSLQTSVGMDLQFNDGYFSASVGTKFNKTFRENENLKINGSVFSPPTKISSSYQELNAKISAKINDTLFLDMLMGKSFGGRNGASMSLTLSFAL